MVLKDYLEESEFRERMIDWAFKNNSNIKDFGEFNDALTNSFDTPRGKRILNNLDFQDIKMLWESKELNSRSDFKENRREAGLPINTDDEVSNTYQGGRKKDIGEPTKPKDIFVVPITKNVTVKPYRSHGRTIHGYNRGYGKWKSSQLEFLKEYKTQKIPPKQIIDDFNAHFKQNGRSASSIRTRLYRL